jgi:hypothetical protein
MNVTSSAPLSLPVSTANLPTESVQIQNRLAERVPATQKTFELAPSRPNETGPQQSTNSQNTQASDEARPRIVGSREEQGNTDDQQSSSGDRSDQQQERQEQAEIAELAAIDRKVRSHELAHSTVGGVYAGAPNFSYKTGPNGVRYAVAGEVPIDISPVPGNPEATLRKAQQVVRAALAPADPSPVDRRVAAIANALASRARFEITRMASEEAQSAFRVNAEGEEEQGPQPFERAGISFGGSQLRRSLATDATEQVGGQVSASA